MKIKKISEGEIKPTWDIEVPDGNEYLTGNGCVSHNTASILGNNESFEPYTNNIYTRRVLSGEFIIINEHLVQDLIELDLWNDDIRNRIIKENGSIQYIDEIPDHIKMVYRKVWEVKQKEVIQMSADRGAFICQSQSLNLHIEDVNTAKLSSAHMFAWKAGVKTGMYYLRSQPSVQALKGLGVDLSESKPMNEPVVEQTVEDIEACNLDDPDCLMCSA